MKYRFGLVLLLASAHAWAADTAPAPPADELASINAISAAWDRYAKASSRDEAAAAELITSSSARHYLFLRDAALAASTDQIRRIPISDRMIAYALRATRSKAELESLDGAGVARTCHAEGWCGVAAPEDGGALPSLTHVTLVSPEHAIGELGPPTGTQFQFGPELRLEQGEWRVATDSTAWAESLLVQQQIQRAGMSENEMVEFLLHDFLGDERDIPPLAVLDRPLVDDPSLRTRLNESWPDYPSNFRTRVRALEVKADRGDALAQFALGGMYYSGQPAGLVSKDPEKGLSFLEAASDNGHAMAAAGATEALIALRRPAKGKAPSPELLARMGRHMKRAAEGGIPGAMVAWGNYVFNGAGGMTRDCRLAEEWAARGEDAGIAHARNERVWYLATCPIPQQRDPARALELAAHMMAKADELPAGELDTVAAALAANGRFDEAQDYQSRALAKLGADEVVTRKGMKERLELYRKRRDWVQTYDSLSRPRQ